MEMATLLEEAVQVVNSSPIAWGKQSKNHTYEGPITPLHLQLGRASVELLEVNFDLNPSLTKRLRYMDDIKKEFWKKWLAQVFQGQMLAQKWRKRHCDAQAGNMKLVKNEMLVWSSRWGGSWRPSQERKACEVRRIGVQNLT